MIAVGIIGGLLAAFFGLIDWLAIPSGTRAKVIGLGHGLSNAVMVMLFALSWLLRSGARRPWGLAYHPLVHGRGSRFARGLPRERSGLPDGHRGGGRGEPERFGLGLRTRLEGNLDRHPRGMKGDRGNERTLKKEDVHDRATEDRHPR
jgi:hypothetical protein